MIFNNYKEKIGIFSSNIQAPMVMGILNVTPDSFFDGGKYTNEKEILNRVENMMAEGSDIIDIGGYSSRPSAENISEEEEKRRLYPAFELILKKFPSVVFSIDTFRSNIAKQVVNDYNVSIINDISGGTLDENMFSTVASLPVSYVLMHMKGTPQNMQKNDNIIYNNVTNDVFCFFSNKIKELKSLGISNIIIDPGFGFAKTTEQNYELLKNLSNFCIFEMPILVGMSRKTMLWKTLECQPTDCLNATTVVNTLALANGAKILRVHDVKEAVETVKIFQKYNNV
jgi:dihydropteroate synthase